MKENDNFDEQMMTDKSFFGKVKKGSFIKEGYENSKNVISKTSSNLMESVYKNVHKKTEETAELINGALNKNSRLHNLEALLYVSKACLVSSSKLDSVYKPMPKKIVIFEKDKKGNVESITVKEDSKVSTYVVKYTKYKPFVYPSFSDDRIPGEVYYMNKNEIWYRQDNTLTICYKKNTKMEFTTLDLSEFKDLTEENLISFIKKHNAICRSPKLANLVEENNIEIIDIIRVTDKYIIEKCKEFGYVIYVYDNLNRVFNKLSLNKLPNIKLSSFDAIFTTETSQFITENNYPIEQFEEYEGYLEYNKIVAGRKICVFRTKI